MLSSKELKRIFAERKKLTQAVSVVVNQAITTLVEWANILNKPTEFPPEDHTHSKDDLSDWKNNFSSTVNPTTSNDNTEGYSVGSIWLNTTSNISFQCMDATINNAIWKILTSTITDDAPIDGQTYGRKDGNWFTITTGSGEPELLFVLGFNPLGFYALDFLTSTLIIPE